MQNKPAPSVEVLINSHTGDKLFMLTGTEINSYALRMEAVYKPAKNFAPEHYHPHQDEQFNIQSGRLMTKINGVIREYKAGEKFNIPKGVKHAMYNASNEEVRFSWEVTPALQTSAFLRRVYAETNSGEANKKGLTGIMQKLILLKDFRQEFVLSKIPLSIQNALFTYVLPALNKK